MVFPEMPPEEAAFIVDFERWMKKYYSLLPGEEASLDVRDNRWVSGLRVSQVCKVCGKFVAVRMLSRAALDHENRLEYVLDHRQHIQDIYLQHLAEEHKTDEAHLRQAQICPYCGEEDAPHAGCILADILNRRKAAT